MIRHFEMVVLVLLSVLFLGCAQQQPKIDEQVIQELETQGETTVLVKLKPDTSEEVIQELQTIGLKLEDNQTLTGTITSEILEQLKNKDGIAEISKKEEIENISDYGSVNRSYNLNESSEEGIASEAIVMPIEHEPAPAWLLDKAKEYIVLYIGEEYFNQHISVKKSWTESEIDKIGAKYRIYYTYKFKIKGDINETSIEFVLWLDPDGNLVEYRGIKYRGPQKPYIFGVSRSEAIEAARDEGIEDIENIAVVLGLGFRSDKGVINESYVWHIVAKNSVEGEPEIIYLDVDSGEIIDILTISEGRKTVFPAEDVQI